MARTPPAVLKGLVACFMLVFSGRSADGVDTVPVLEGLIAQARAAHGTLTTPIRAAAAFVGGEAGGAGSSSSSTGSGSSSGVTLIVRAVTDEQAQVGG